MGGDDRERRPGGRGGPRGDRGDRGDGGYRRRDMGDAKEGGPLESSLLLFVAGLVEAVVLLLLRGSHSTRASINKIKGLQSMRLNGSVFSRVKETAGVVAVEGGR